MSSAPEFNPRTEYSRSYLQQQQLATCHLSKLKFSNEVISQGDQEWSEYLEAKGITSQQGIKLVWTESGDAAVLYS